MPRNSKKNFPEDFPTTCFIFHIHNVQPICKTWSEESITDIPSIPNPKSYWSKSMLRLCSICKFTQ
jgi:hypothetical protein